MYYRAFRNRSTAYFNILHDWHHMATRASRMYLPRTYSWFFKRRMNRVQTGRQRKRLFLGGKRADKPLHGRWSPLFTANCNIKELA